MSSFPELYFNVDNGYLEGLVRGFKAGVLRQGDYVNLVQCESLEGEWWWGGPLRRAGIPPPRLLLPHPEGKSWAGVRGCVAAGKRADSGGFEELTPRLSRRLVLPPSRLLPPSSADSVSRCGAAAGTAV